MRFKGDVKQMPDNPNFGVPGKEGLFKVVIYYDDSPGSITNYRLHEVTVDNVGYEEGYHVCGRLCAL